MADHAVTLATSSRTAHVSTHRILRDNRRDRHRGPNLGTLVLHAAAWLLALVGMLGRRAAKRQAPMRLSEVLDERYREWARGEAEG